MTNVLVALAAALSPNARRPPFYFDGPFRLVDGVRRPLEPAHSHWQAYALLDHIEQYTSNLQRLPLICMSIRLMSEHRGVLDISMASSAKDGPRGATAQRQSPG